MPFMYASTRAPPVTRSPLQRHVPAATWDLGKHQVRMDLSYREFKTEVLSPFRSTTLFLLPKEGATPWD